MNRRVDVHDPHVTGLLLAAPVWRQKKIVTARPARAGERLTTTLAGGSVKTVRTLTGSEVVVTNPGGEQYAIAGERFWDRYENVGGYQWRATGLVHALRNPWAEPITITAPWGEVQHGTADCMIAMVPGVHGDRYLIGAAEFTTTYEEVR